MDSQLQHFSEFIIEKMDERFAEVDKRFEEQKEWVEQKLSVAMEDFDDRLAFAVENLDERIERKTKPIEEKVEKNSQDLAGLKTALKDTSKEPRELDTALGKVEHRVDMSQKFSQMALSQSTRIANQLEQRVAQLEAKV